ncbi:MAG: hypothetical protein JWO13_326 [Acidobacteriales bacterium]|nr:hypothetical protein [Terriglobales bacterium]
MQLYRRIAVLVTAGTLLFSSVAPYVGAQTQNRKKNSGPRAIAVVQWQTDAKGKAVPRLLPVAILDDGKFYDSSLYKATPTPMALEPGIVYEAQDEGERLGYFTIGRSFKTSTEEQNWVGLGQWKSDSPKADAEYSRLNARQSAEVVRGIMQPAPQEGDFDDRELKKKRTTVYDENGKEIPEGTEAKDDKGGNRPTLRRPSKPTDTSGAPSDKSGTDTSSAPTQKKDDSDKPTLKRPGDTASGGDDPKPKSTSKNDDPDRPTLKRGANSGGDSAKTQGQDQSPSSGDPAKTTGTPAATTRDDPERPRIKRGVPEKSSGANVSPEQEAKSNAKAMDADPNRPALRRGPQVPRKEVEEKSAGVPVPERILKRGSRMFVADTSRAGVLLPGYRVYETVAVSDASAAEQESFRFRWSADEKTALSAKMRELAQREVDAFLKATGKVVAAEPVVVAKGSRPSGARTGHPQVLAPKTQFTEEQSNIAALDLNHNNAPTLVFTGHQRIQSSGGQPQEVFVTLVSRVDLEGNPRKVFSNVTSSDRLDVKPRLEFIDALDADGKGKGQLLFRRTSDVGSEFAIYRAGLDEMVEMFHGGGGQ